MQQLNIFDFTQDETFKDDNELLADKIIKEICEFIDKKLLPHCFPLEKKETEFAKWDHTPNQGKNITIIYRFKHNWEYTKNGSYKFISEDDTLINTILYKSKLIDKINSYKKGVECDFRLSPGTLYCFVHGVEKPLKKSKKIDLVDEDYECDC